MTYVIPDTFSDKLGRFLNWDTTIQYDGSKGFFSTNQHVNVRNFRIPGSKPLPQSSLEAETQASMETVVEQSLETQPGNNDEAWTLTGTGLSGFSYGAVAARNNWSGAQATTTGTSINATLQSSMTEVIDISSMDVLSTIFADYNAFDTATSYIQLSSEPTGSFGTAAYLSGKVYFSANTATMPELRVPISGFSSGAGASFALTRITGVQIVLAKATAPTSGLAVTVMAMRALKNAWVYKQMDFDTRLGALVESVSLDGNAPGAGTNTIPMIRGLGDKNDPIPADISLNLYFYSGMEATNVATGSNYNVVELYFREQKDLADNLGSWMVARFKWNSTGSVFETVRYDWSGGTLTNTTTKSYSVGAILSAKTHYLLTVGLVGTSFQAVLYLLDGNDNVQNYVWRGPLITSTDYPFRNGRVGLNYTFLDRDAYIDNFQSATLSYGTFETQVWPQRTPVDGAQLTASFAQDMNLFQTFTGSDLVIDQTKTVSGFGSFATQAGVTSNTFIVEDWNNQYIDLAIWMPNTLTTLNAPVFALISQADGTTNYLAVPRLQPSQWNYLHFDLGQFLKLITGVGYTLTVTPAAQPDVNLGTFWLDKVVFGRRRVRWGIRATSGGLYREFRDLVNTPNGAIHFTPEERGTQLELRCDALTSDAWVAESSLKPRHAELGNPVYDRGYATS